MTDMLDEHPDLSIDEIIDVVTRENVAENKDNAQYPTASRAGQGTTNRARRKFSLIIGNSDYNQALIDKKGTGDVRALQ
ncbi:MAG: hypothetical protein ACJATT_003245 [Myxococcota bacterium]|jgi:hypothetical protein